MANIRVTCPACKSELEIDEAFDGQEVECGNCLEVFTAKGPKPSGAGKSGTGKIPGTGKSSSTGTSGAGSSRSKPADKPARKKRRDDDDDDYEHDRRRRNDDDDDEDYAPPPPRRSSGGGGTGLGVTSLILGILSIPSCCCGILSLPFSLGAIATGAIGLSRPGDKAMPTIGLILGIIGLSLVALRMALGFGLLFNNPQQFR